MRGRRTYSTPTEGDVPTAVPMIDEHPDVPQLKDLDHHTHLDQSQGDRPNLDNLTRSYVPFLANSSFAPPAAPARCNCNVNHHSPVDIDSLIHKPSSDIPDPSPVGLAGFSSVIFLVSLYSVGATSVLRWIVPVGLLAGITLLLGSYFHFRNAHSFPATTFGFYGAFWLGVSLSLMFSGDEDFDETIAYVRIPIAIFTFYAMVGSLFISKASLVLFVSLECKLVCFIIGYLCHVPALTIAGGCFGIICASSGYYASASLLLKPFLTLPLGAPMLVPSTRSQLSSMKLSASKRIPAMQKDQSSVQLILGR